MRTDAGACLPEIVKLMRTLTHGSNQVSVTELAEIIQKDAAILAKVIAAANMLGYNPAAIPVTTVFQAIHVIGYEKIRSLAMSLLLVEQSNRTQSTDEKREVAALALTAGCIAQSAAGSRLAVDPEEAFVCASLRNFGRLIMVTCMLEEYRQARQLAVARPLDSHASDEAFRQIFGLTPLELGHALLKSSNLPEDILATMRPLPPEAFESIDAPNLAMLALTDFSAQLAEIALTPQLAAADFAERSAALAARYQALLPHLADEIEPLLESTASQLGHFTKLLRIKSLPAHTIMRLRQRSANIDPAESLASANSQAARSSAVSDRVSSTSEPTSISSNTQVTISDSPAAPAIEACSPVSTTAFWQAEIERIAALPPTAHRDARLHAATGSLKRGLEATECLLFWKNASDSDYSLTQGSGACYNLLDRRTRIRAQDRTIFGVCTTRGENILIHRAADPKIAPYLPPWMPKPDALGAFVLLPLIADGASAGVILIGWKTPRQIAISPEHVRLIRTLLATAC